MFLASEGGSGAWQQMLRGASVFNHMRAGKTLSVF